MSDTRTTAELLAALRRQHLIIDEDCWYSCPASGECCRDDVNDDCTCGADRHNATLDALTARIEALEAEHEAMKELVLAEQALKDARMNADEISAHWGFAVTDAIAKHRDAYDHAERVIRGE